MICPYCGTSLANGANFCPECGKKLDAAAASALDHSICPFCGEILEPNSIFCENCGRPLSSQPSSASYAPHTSAEAALPHLRAPSVSG